MQSDRLFVPAPDLIRVVLSWDQLRRSWSVQAASVWTGPDGVETTSESYHELVLPEALDVAHAVLEHRCDLRAAR